MKCNTPIDPETRIALSGEALAAALNDPDSSRCGYELEAGDMFCPSCGAKVECPTQLDSTASTDPCPTKGPGKKLTAMRATRSNFWWAAATFFLLNILYFIVSGGDLDISNVSLSRRMFLTVLGYVNLFAYAYFIKTSVRRLHDMNRSGWWILPSVVFTLVATITTVVSAVSGSDNAIFSVCDVCATIANLAAVVWLGFAKGTQGPNKYGPDPRADAGVPVGFSNPRRGLNAWVLVVVVVCGVVSFMFQYHGEKEKKRFNDMLDWQRQICNSVTTRGDYATPLDLCLESASKSIKFKSKNRTRLDGMFGVKFGERVPSDVATLTDGTEGTLMLYFSPESPELEFSQYCKTMLPQTRVVCGIQGISIFSEDERGRCLEIYEKYKKDIGRRYGDMATLRRKPGRSKTDGSEEVSQSIVECEDKRIITLQVRKSVDGGYLLRLIALDMNVMERLSEERKQVLSDTLPLEGLFGRKLGVHVDETEDEVKCEDGSVTQSFEPSEKFLDFESYAIHFLPKSRKACMIVAVHSCTTMDEATACFTRACRKMEETFKQKLFDNTATFDTLHPDADGEQMLKSAVLTFPNGLRLLAIQALKNVNDNSIFVRVVALDQEVINALQSEVE